MTDTMIDEEPDTATSDEDAKPVLVEDYFGSDETYKVYLPDGVQYVECKYMTEGDRCKYQAKVQRDVKVDQRTNQTIIRLPTGEERKALLEAVITGWNLRRKGNPVEFNSRNLAAFLTEGKPKAIDAIQKGIQKNEGSWLVAGEVTIEEIRNQIKDLEELIEQKEREEEGKGS